MTRGRRPACEKIAAVNDHRVVEAASCRLAPHYCNGAVLANGRLAEGMPVSATADRFADFTVTSATTSRRVLVLIH